MKLKVELDIEMTGIDKEYVEAIKKHRSLENEEQVAKHILELHYQKDFKTTTMFYEFKINKSTVTNL